MRYFSSAIFAVCFFTFLPSVTQANITTNDFVTTWNTENTGTSANNQITIPGTGAGYSYSIYWESLSSSTATGTIATSTSASQTITFPESGQYKVAIKGTYPRIYFNNGGDKLKILTVEQWGSNAWTSMDSAFRGCANLTVPVTDAPDLSGVTSLRYMFNNASSFNESIDHWNVSNVTSIYGMFEGATSFNQSLNNWDVSNVTSMSRTFINTSSFNQPLNNWNVSKVTDMSGMFNGASIFNQSLDSWDVSNVTNMSQMLRGNTLFNQPLNSWNVSKVTTMRDMFTKASSFNQPLNSWNVSSTTDMRSIFFQASSFNQPLDSWDVSNVTLMDSMFRDTPFNQSLDNWDTNNVTSMYQMFNNATAFNQNLSTWNIANVTTMDQMFLNAHLSQTNLDATLQGWAGQSLNSNVPFHLGLKTYSQTGATALDTLQNTYNWTITEQYQAEYQEGDDYTLSGTTIQSPITSGSSTTAVEVTPDERCTFINWSDNNTTNPRTDTLTDNLTVTANVECRNPSSGSSATTRYKKLLEYGNTTEAEAVKEKYLTTTPTNPTTQTLETAIINIKTLTTNQAITNNPESRQQLISILQQLVQILRGMAGESN